MGETPHENAGELLKIRLNPTFHIPQAMMRNIRMIKIKNITILTIFYTEKLINSLSSQIAQVKITQSMFKIVLGQAMVIKIVWI